MRIRTFQALLKARDLSQSELARRVGVTRQAVSLWFRQEEANIQSRHLLGLSQVLGVPAEMLARPLPCFASDTHARLRATLLWDRLYPDLDDFAVAVNRSEPRALARFVEVYGFFAAEKTVGKKVWKKFPVYKRYIPRERRRQCEILWDWQESREAA